MPTERTTACTKSEILPGIWLDSRLAVWFEHEGLLVIADLHWGYAASHRARGNLLPWWGDDDIESRLRSLISDYAPQEMLWLGDIVHAVEGAGRADLFLRTVAIPTILVGGNHDRRWARTTSRAVQRGQYYFHHGDAMTAAPANSIEVIGHHHPAFAWSDGAGGRVKLPALVVMPKRLVLPAFSPWAAGTEWRRDAGTTLWVVAPKRIFAVQGCDAPAAV